MPKPVLRLHLLAHPGSSSARVLARELMRRFNDPPVSGGLRVPTLFTPDGGDGKPPAWGSDGGIDLDGAEHTLVVVLADARMARMIDFGGDVGTGAEWRSFLAEGAQRAPVGASPHHIFGVAIARPRDSDDGTDDAVYALGGVRHMIGVRKEPSLARRPDEMLDNYADRVTDWIEEAADEIAMHVAIRAIHLLEQGKVPSNISPEQKAPVRLFLSHAKADLRSDESDAVRSVQAAVRDLPIEAWFDAAEIRPGKEFEEELAAGVKDCTILVAFLTDRYASRPWCRREVLSAKRVEAPILVVDALSDGEPRNFAYLGNVPTVHWTGRDPQLEAMRVVSRAVREALRFIHNRATIERIAEPGEVVIAAPPEALSLVWRAAADGQGSFLYPDPPLSHIELELVRSLRPEASFETPLSKLAREYKSVAGSCLAVSTSVSDDMERLGLSRAHEEALFDEIHGYLLLAGARIVYGGALQADISQGSNFTHRLFELVRAYSKIAENAAIGAVAPILNVAPWPLHLAYGEEEAKLFGVVADYREGKRPPRNEVPEDDRVLFPARENPHRLPETPERRLAWARGLTAMRETVTRFADARLVIGGALSTFKGVVPGVVDEAWMSMAAGRPLFVAGGFGGAAAAVADSLLGRDRSELSVFSAAAAPHIQAAVKLAESRGLDPVQRVEARDPRSASPTAPFLTLERAVDDFATWGTAGPAAALANGLTDGENLELFASTDAARIAELVLEGLSRLRRGLPDR